MINSKKAQSESGEKSLFYIVAGIFIIGLFFLFAYIITYDINVESMIPKNLEREILIARFLVSPDCFVYKDEELLRVYPYVFDKEKLTNERLEECYDVKQEGYAFRLSFDNLKEIVLKTKNWNDFRGSEREVFNIKIFDNGKFYDAKLFVEIQKNE